MTNKVKHWVNNPIYKVGFQEGRQRGHQDVLDILETKYMSDNIERGSEMGEAILQLAKNVAEELRGKVN